LVSERKFKEQLKNWTFEKNITATEMGFVAAKEEGRSREQGKSTTFYNRSIKINPKKIDAFKKRISQPVEEKDNAGKGNDTVTDSSHSDIMGVATPQQLHTILLIQKTTTML
jgi:hypothetical protein